MKSKMSMQVIGLSLKVNEGKEGKHYYQISVDQDGEAGSLPLSEDAYLNIKDSFKKYSPYGLTVEYNDQYKSLRVIGLQALR